MKVETAKAILLLEFINTEQFPGQICWTLPVLKGYADWLGIPCRWLRFGMPAAHFFRHGEDAIVIGEEELGALERVLDDLLPARPDLVVKTHELGVGIIGLLERRLPGAVTVHIDKLDWPNLPLPLEMDRPGFRPDYRFEPGNEEALRPEFHNVYVFGSVGCGYRRSLRHNPYYEDLELPSGKWVGCAFCGARAFQPLTDGERPRCETDGAAGPAAEEARRALAAGTLRIPIELVRRQVDSIARTLSPDRLPNALLLPDIERKEILAAVVDAVQGTGVMRDVPLLVALRADRLVDLADWLWETFASAKRAPVALQLFSCGIESFVAEELDRMHKGTTPQNNLRAVNLLKELEAASRGRFFYSGYMGLSVLLFTPWTTLDDLHLNIGLILHLRIEAEIGNLFMSRLRLHPDLAITYLAARDGLVVSEGDAEDEALRLNRRKLFAEELAWRHRDERMAAVTRIAVRLERDECLREDELYREIQRRFVTPLEIAGADLSRRGRRRILVEALRVVIESALSAPEPLGVDDLLREATQAWRSRSKVLLRRPRSGHCARWRTLLSDAAADEWRAVGGEDRAVLFDLTDDEGAVATVEVVCHDEDGIRYDPRSVRLSADAPEGRRVLGASRAEAPGGRFDLVAGLQGGDRLRFRPGQILVLRDQQPVAVWTASVGFYCPRRRWHVAEWRELSRAALRNADPESERAREVAWESARRWCADPAIMGLAPEADDTSAPEVEPGKVIDWAELTLTSRCNQRCFFCYEDGRDVARDPRLEEVKEILEATASRSDQAVLCGKEVLLRPDVLEIVRHGSSLGLQMVVFSNAQALARPGVVERLADAGCGGLTISFHFPDAESFARCARVPKKGFKRQLEGMARIAEYNRKNPDRPLGVSTETDMFAANLGRLADMRRRLSEAFGETPWEMRLACLLPCKVHDIGLPAVMDSMEDRRRELKEFLASHPPSIPLQFVKTPLCLLPEEEMHRSLELAYVARQTDLSFNHEEVGEITSDTMTVSVGRDVLGMLGAHPYRFVCRTCRLVAVCRFDRVSWHAPDFLPRREDKPTPIISMGVRELLERKMGRVEQESSWLAGLDELDRRLEAHSYPEEEIVAALLEPQASPGPVLQEVFIDRAPLMALRFDVAGEEVVLQLGMPRRDDGVLDLGAAVGYLVVREARPGGASPEALRACLERLGRIDLPPIERFEGEPYFDGPAMAAAFKLSRRLGERLWPEIGRFGEWRVVKAELRDLETLRIEAAHSDGRRQAQEIALEALFSSEPETLLQRLFDAVPARTARAKRPTGASELVLKIRDPAEPEAALVFFIAPYRDGAARYLRVGRLMMWYNGQASGKPFDWWSRMVQAAMNNLQETPWSAAMLPRWRYVIEYLLERAALPRTFKWSLEWTGEDSED